MTYDEIFKWCRSEGVSLTTDQADAVATKFATPPAVMPAAPSDAVTDAQIDALLDRNADALDIVLDQRGRMRRFARAVLALSQPMQPQAEPAAGEQAGAVAKMMPKGFLSDVMTAAGLVEHGRQCKALSERLVAGINAIRGANIAAPGAAIAAREQPPNAVDVLDEFEAEHNGFYLEPAQYTEWFNKLRAALASREEAPVTPQAETLTDEQLSKAAYKGYDQYWTEDCAGKESEAWLASAKAVLALKGVQPVERKDGAA